MGIFDVFTTKCGICKRKIKPLRAYTNDQGKVMKVCLPCSEYAERRAYRLLQELFDLVMYKFGAVLPDLTDGNIGKAVKGRNLEEPMAPPSFSY